MVKPDTKVVHHFSLVPHINVCLSMYAWECAPATHRPAAMHSSNSSWSLRTILELWIPEGVKKEGRDSATLLPVDNQEDRLACSHTHMNAPHSMTQWSTSSSLPHLPKAFSLGLGSVWS